MSRSIFDAGPPPPCPSPFNMAHYVLSAGQDADVALVVASARDGRPATWRYADLRGAVHRTAGGLMARGIRPGDRILLRVGNDPAFPVVFLAAIMMGAVPVPISPMLTEPEVHAIHEALEPALTIFAGGLHPIALPGTQCDSDDLRAMSACDPVGPVMGSPDRLAFMIYTSGTSGKPRAVMHAHRAVWARRMMWDGWYGLRPTDRVLHAGAFNWTYTLGTGLMDPWAIGATAMIYTGPAEPGIWSTLSRNLSPTIFAAAPGVYRQITQHGATGFDGLRHGLSAGEALSPEIRNAWRDQTGTELYEALGMSECSTFISGAPGVTLPDGAAGRVQPGRRLAVLDAAGEAVPWNTPGTLGIHKSDPGLMLGYFRHPDETMAKYSGDWFVTGDTVRMDVAGVVHYLGRDDDMMNAGGFRVSPIEVETAMLSHPEISEAAAAEVEVRTDVRVIAGFFVGTADEDALITFLSERLAKYKRPRIVVRMPALPRGANNKLSRKSLRDWSPK